MCGKHTGNHCHVKWGVQQLKAISTQLKQKQLFNAKRKSTFISGDSVHSLKLLSIILISVWNHKIDTNLLLVTTECDIWSIHFPVGHKFISQFLTLVTPPKEMKEDYMNLTGKKETLIKSFVPVIINKENYWLFYWASVVQKEYGNVKNTCIAASINVVQ